MVAAKFGSGPGPLDAPAAPVPRTTARIAAAATSKPPSTRTHRPPAVSSTISLNPACPAPPWKPSSGTPPVSRNLTERSVTVRRQCPMRLIPPGDRFLTPICSGEIALGNGRSGDGVLDLGRGGTGGERAASAERVEREDVAVRAVPAGRAGRAVAVLAEAVAAGTRARGNRAGSDARGPG